MRKILSYSNFYMHKNMLKNNIITQNFLKLNVIEIQKQTFVLNSYRCPLMCFYVKKLLNSLYLHRVKDSCRMNT